MTRTCYTLDDVGGALPWSSLDSFIKNLRTDSALARDLGHETGWENILKTNGLLADIYDLLQAINANIITLSGKHAKKIKPYPRPGREEIKRIGNGAMPYNELREWIKERKHG